MQRNKPTEQLSAVRKAADAERAKQVRCLGLDPEHTFVSRDPVNIRICSDCKREMTRRHHDGSRRMFQPMTCAVSVPSQR